MAEFEMIRKAPLGNYMRSFGEMRLIERPDLALVSLAVSQGGEKALAKAVKAAWGISALPEPGQSVLGKDNLRLIWTGADQYMVQFSCDAPQAEKDVDKVLKGSAYLSDQTHGWVTLEIDGNGTREALARLSMIDLHPDRFAENAVARTVMEHMGAMVIRCHGDKFLLMSASSSALSFLHAVETSIVNIC